MTDVLRLFGPLVLWLGSFSAIYGLHAVLCVQGWDRSVLVGAWLLAVALQVGVLLALTTDRFGARPGFARWTSVALATVSLVAMVWTLSPIAVLGACR